MVFVSGEGSALRQGRRSSRPRAGRAVDPHEPEADRTGMTRALSADCLLSGSSALLTTPLLRWSMTCANCSWLEWGDDAVVRLAKSIYDKRSFGRLPILADTLEKAGCYDEQVLGHCRE